MIPSLSFAIELTVFKSALAADFAFGGGDSCRLCLFGGEGDGGKEGKGFKVWSLRLLRGGGIDMN